MHFSPHILPVLCLVAPAAWGQTITVTTVEDSVDFGGAQTVNQLPGPDGVVSFREAVIAANLTAGPQTIEFAIPQSDWWFFTDMALLRLEDGVFWITDDDTTVDFSSQTAFTGDTNPNGPEVGIYGLQANGWGIPAIGIGASDCHIHGLGFVGQRGHAIWIGAGDRNRVTGCVTSSVKIDPQPSTSSFNVIGGTGPGEGNVLNSVEILCSAHDNVVIGNQLQSVRVEGSPYCSIQYPLRNRIGGPTPAERNVFSGAGSRGSEGLPVGQNVQVSWAQETLIQGNYIGLTPDGSTRVPQLAPSGVVVSDSIQTWVLDNVIAGMHIHGTNHYSGQLFGQAILINAINADNSQVWVEGNLIGTDATGTNPILTRSGIRVVPATGARTISDVLIGGRDGNLIAYTQLEGIAIHGGNAQAELSHNSIHSNGALGIDLGTFFQGADGVNANDNLDADTQGGNQGQNHPLLLSVRTNGTAVALQGLLQSTPNRTMRIEFFANTVCDPSGYGEGETPLGSRTVTTDSQGMARFMAFLPAAVPVGAYVTSTATDLVERTTSEFGPCTVAIPGQAMRALAPRPEWTDQ